MAQLRRTTQNITILILIHVSSRSIILIPVFEWPRKVNSAVSAFSAHHTPLHRISLTFLYAEIISDMSHHILLCLTGRTKLWLKGELLWHERDECNKYQLYRPASPPFVPEAIVAWWQNNIAPLSGEVIRWPYHTSKINFICLLTFHFV